MHLKHIAGAALLLSLALGVSLAGNLPAPAQAGNGAPSGAHYNLNLIGVDKAHENVNPDGYKGHVIFVPLTGKCDIGLTEGDYGVIDKSCLDGDRAKFSLPDPDNGEGSLAYSVWVRALGKPGGEMSMTTCFDEFDDITDPTAGTTTWCNDGALVVSLTRLVGPSGPKFVDVSKELLQVCADVNNDPLEEELDLVPLFSDEGENYFWHYDNKGLRLLQMRFYPVSTTEIGGYCERQPHPAHE